MKFDDQLIALIAEADPAPRSAPLDAQHGDLAQRVRQRVLQADRSAGHTGSQGRTAQRQRHAPRGFGNAALVAASVLVVVVVVGAFSLLGRSRHTEHATGPKPSSIPPIPTVGQVKAAMDSQPRIAQIIRGPHGEEWARVVVDFPAGYQAVYANAGDPAYHLYKGLPKGRLTLLDLVEDGYEYRWTSPSGCYVRRKGSPVSRQALFGSDLPEAPSARPGRTSADVVAYRGQEGARIMVNRRTGLIQSAAQPGIPNGNVPAARTTYSYPASVSELSVPHTCP
jgi:hypothetical protein